MTPSTARRRSEGDPEMDGAGEAVTLAGDPFPASWARVAAVLGDPALLLQWDEAALGELVFDLRNERLLPLAARRIKASPAYASLSQAFRQDLELWVMRHKAGHAVIAAELEQVLSTLAGRGLHPIPIKGAHLAFCCYDEPYLRPMSDVDLLFADLKEGGEAFRALEDEGYVPKEVNRGGDPWLWSRHLPEMESPRTNVRVEIHGGLIYAPRDRRHGAERSLLDGLQSANCAGHDVKVLAPEAAAVFALAHTFERHAADAPHLIVLFDVAALAAKAGDAFDWNRLADLARRSGFAAPVSRGLAALRRFMGTAVPEEVIRDGSDESARPSSPAPSAQSVRTGQDLRSFRNTPLLGALEKGFFMVFPSPAFMRWRYPDRPRTPLPLLYPLRWAIQLAKGINFVRSGASWNSKL